MIDTQLKDRIAIITGGNHGIGASTAKKYQENRAKTADKVVREIHENGGQAESFEIDLFNIQNIPVLVDKAEQVFGPVDILVNNAAYCNPDTFVSDEFVEEKTGLNVNTISVDDQEKHFAINTRSTSLLMKEFANRLIVRKSNWGRIINISTDWAECFPSSISYGASKMAMEAYSRAAAVELGKYGVTVNIVSPGPTQTGWMSPEIEETQAKHCPLGRVGQPEDIADVIVFLASQQARWVTGQRLFVGGGNRIV